MKIIRKIEFRNESKEELLPDFEQDFPYLASYTELDYFPGRFVPWHWHKEVELFLVEKGAVEYYTPKGKTVFSAGSGGFLNSNVLHSTKPAEGIRDTAQMEHIFDAAFIGGEASGRINRKYVAPIIQASQIEIMGFYPGQPEQEEMISLLRESFLISPEESGYELKLRSLLSDIWRLIYELSEPVRNEKKRADKSNEKLKIMMLYIKEHYGERLRIREIAAAAFISERECFRVFQSCLRMTPVEYLKSFRLQKACQMLSGGHETITAISYACGLGSSSYFGKQFHEYTGLTPLAYRNKWRNNDINGQK